MTKSNIKKGIGFGILVGLAWGLDSVLMGKVGEATLFQGTGPSASLITAGFHDGFAFMWLMLIMLFTKNIKKVFALIKTPAGKATMIAALVGAPIGMSGYVIGLKYATPAYASSISVIYPGVGAIMSYLILKEKLSKTSVIGIGLSLIGSIMLGVTGASSAVAPNFMLGVSFTLLAVVGWASEGVIVAYAMKKFGNTDSKVEVKPEYLLTLRYMVSAVSYAFVVIPFVGGYSLAGEIISSGLFLAYAGIAILGVITYLSWYKAVGLIGGAMGTALNSTSAFWAVIFSALLLGTPISGSQVLWGVVIIVGVFVFAIGPTMSKKQ